MVNIILVNGSIVINHMIMVDEYVDHDDVYVDTRVREEITSFTEGRDDLTLIAVGMNNLKVIDTVTLVYRDNDASVDPDVMDGAFEAFVTSVAESIKSDVEQMLIQREGIAVGALSSLHENELRTILIHAGSVPVERITDIPGFNAEERNDLRYRRALARQIITRMKRS